MVKVQGLFAPMSYRGAPKEVRDIAVNGCGTGGWKGALVPETMWGLDIREACNIHDWMYLAGETIADKEEADRVFLNNLLRIIETDSRWEWLAALRRRRALKYYEAVRVFGGPAFWNGKNPNGTMAIAAAN
jgi:hypothetical protein